MLSENVLFNSKKIKTIVEAEKNEMDNVELFDKLETVPNTKVIHPKTINYVGKFDKDLVLSLSMEFLEKKYSM